jgi:hypothetical protein
MFEAANIKAIFNEVLIVFHADFQLGKDVNNAENAI